MQVSLGARLSDAHTSTQPPMNDEVCAPRHRYETPPA
eukprot:CAMPEP_0196679294 /NCGR_PEP_ID=MMETSP1090-20130531/6982_1 /TAXON_ID=37098 /ORGANISM="Isochrysis sp, Strain CCMP1244" /LENGTH=36 /DNA_ID= /DNA_START= /DNA_END= /DNA_ORIENTATION=